MHASSLDYTSIYAPVVFFLFGIISVIMLNKFIGTGSIQNKSE
jgi:hypothetical protein